MGKQKNEFGKPYGNKVINSPCKNCFFEQYGVCILDRKCDYDVYYNRFLRCLIPLYKENNNE